MGHYLFTASLSQTGLHGLINEGPEARRKAVEETLASLGGKLDKMYWTFGDTDVLVLADLPDNAAAASFSTTIAAAGAASIRTTVVLTAEDVERMRTLQPTYHPPRG